MKKILYYLLNLTFHTLDKDIFKLFPHKKKLIIFDVGCYRGVFFIRLLNQLKERAKSSKFYLFDINKNVKEYIKDYIKFKNISYLQVALSNKIGKAKYNYNSFFEASGSSLSNIYKDDSKWVSTRKFILKIFLQETNDFISYSVPTITLDSFIIKNKIKEIDIIKIDVDGSEMDVLEGLKKSFKKNKVRMLLTEINERPKNKYNLKVKKVKKFLKNYNFKLIKVNSMLVPEIFSNIKAGDYLFINKKNYK
jgi:FkbM family methyltransferase